MQIPPYGLTTQTRNNTTRDSSLSNHQAFSSNGVTKNSFAVQSFIPSGQACTNTQAKWFSTFNMVPILSELGQKGLIPFPLSPLTRIFSDGLPPMSALSWGHPAQSGFLG